MFNYTGLLFFQGNYLDQDTISFRSCSNSSHISDLQLFPTYFALLTRFVALYIFKSVKTSEHKTEKKNSAMISILNYAAVLVNADMVMLVFWYTKP